MELKFTLVLPHWRIDYQDVEALIIEPLSFLHDARALQQFAADTGYATSLATGPAALCA